MSNPSGVICYMRTVLGKPDCRALTRPLPAVNFDGSPGFVPEEFEWDGSSVPWIFQRLFPRHKHPIASCRHDWRCLHARSSAERKWADEQFRDDVGRTSWWITKQLGYAGVRIGAALGIGVRY